MQQPKKRRNRPERPTIEQIPAEPATGNSKFVRALGSVDPLTRNKAVSALRRWLQMRDSVSEADLVTLWKGLFFCYWHSDLAPVQEELADQLAGLLPNLQQEVAYSYFTTFLLTMRREWFAIDRHRMDKFMNLVRQLVHYLFVTFKQHNWQERLMQRYLDYVTDNVLLASDKLLSVGVSYHLCDVWLPELQNVMGDEQLTDAAAREVLRPFTEALARSDAQPLIARITDAVIQPLIESISDPLQGSTGANSSDGDDSELEHMSDDEAVQQVPDTFGNLDVVPFAETLFERGASADVAFRNRNALYQCHELLCQAAKQRQRVLEAQQLEQAHGEQARKCRKTDGQPQLAEKGAGDSKRADKVSGNGVAAHCGGEEPKERKKKKKQKHAAELQQQGIEQQADGVLAAPEQSKKKKKRKIGDADAAEPLEGPAGAPTNGRGPGHAGAQQPHASLQKTNSMEQQGPSAASTPLSSPHKQLQQANSASPANRHDAGSKSVRWNLKNNLVFPFGGPVPPPDVRTPPSAKPKGSALKVRGTSARLDLQKKLLKKKKKKLNGQQTAGGVTENGAAGY